MAEGRGQLWFKQLVKSDGTPMAGYKVYHYAAGTTTLKNVWTAADKVTPSAQPVIADSLGVAQFYGDGDYKLRIDDADDVTLYTFDNVRITNDVMAVWEGSHGTVNPGVTALGKYQLFLRHDGSDNFLGLAYSDGSSFVDIAATLNSSIINVTSHGAVGDGVTDDTAAIQAAIDAAESAGGGIVFFPVPSVDYRFTTLTVQVAGITLKGASGVGSKLVCTSTTGTAITCDKNSIGLVDIVLNSTGARTAIVATAYADGTPTAGKHGIAFIPSVTASTQFRCFLRNVTVDGNPDDGVIAEQPELLHMSQVDCENNGRFGIHLNGQANNKGINNLLDNCRAANSGNHGIQVRNILNSTLRHLQSLANSGTFHIYLWGGRGIILDNPDVEDTSHNANTAIQIVGVKHEVRNGLILNFLTPINLASADHCTIDRPHNIGTNGTPSTQVVNVDSASDYNLLRVGPLSSHTDTTALVAINASAVGNVVETFQALLSMTADDTTPSVLGVKTLLTVANTGATVITQLDDGLPGQKITIITNDATNVPSIADAGNFKLTAAWNPVLGETLSLATTDGTTWYEIGRTAT